MRKTLFGSRWDVVYSSVALGVSAQANRKPGLWEMTSTMTWQQSPMPSGNDHASRRKLALRRRPAHHPGLRHPGHDRQVRRSRPPEPQQPMHGQKTSQMKPTGMTADWGCTGMMAAKVPSNLPGPTPNTPPARSTSPEPCRWVRNPAPWSTQSSPRPSTKAPTAAASSPRPCQPTSVQSLKSITYLRCHPEHLDSL